MSGTFFENAFLVVHLFEKIPEVVHFFENVPEIEIYL
jgi:hypothetical protein